MKEELKVVFDKNVAIIERNSDKLAFGKRLSNMFSIESEANMCANIDICYKIFRF